MDKALALQAGGLGGRLQNACNASVILQHAYGAMGVEMEASGPSSLEDACSNEGQENLALTR